MVSERDFDTVLMGAMRSESSRVFRNADLRNRVRDELSGHAPRGRRMITIILVATGAIILTSGTAFASENITAILATLHIVKTEPVVPMPAVTTLADARAKAGFSVLTLSSLNSAKLESVMYRSVMLPSGKEALEIDLTYRVGSQYVYVTEARGEGNPLNVKIGQLHTVSGEGASGYGYEDIETLGGHQYLVERTVPGGPFLSIAWETANGISVGITVTAGLSDGLDQSSMMSLVNHLE